MKTFKLVTLFIISISLFSSCNKQAINPCDGLMNESPPLKIGVLLTDKQTGDNLILTNGLKSTDIEITETQTGKLLNNWRLVNTANAPTNGMVEVSVFHHEAGTYTYTISVKDLAPIAVSYNIKQIKSDDPCKTFYYPLEGLKATSNEFKPLVYDGRILTQIIVVTVD